MKDDFPEGIPDLVREWVDVRIEGIASEPNVGVDAIEILKELLRLGRAKSEDLEKSLSIGKGKVLQCLELLSIYKLVVKDYDGSYRPSEDLEKHKDLLEDRR